MHPTPAEVTVQLARHGERPAVVALGTQGILAWSYTELARRVDTLAGGLVHAGLGRGEAVAGLESPPSGRREADS